MPMKDLLKAWAMLANHDYCSYNRVWYIHILDDFLASNGSPFQNLFYEQLKHDRWLFRRSVDWVEAVNCRVGLYTAGSLFPSPYGLRIKRAFVDILVVASWYMRNERLVQLLLERNSNPELA